MSTHTHSRHRRGHRTSRITQTTRHRTNTNRPADHPARHRAITTHARRAALWIRGDLPTQLLPWLLLLGACITNTGFAIDLRNWDFVYSTGLLTCIVFAAVLHIWIAHEEAPR